MSDSVTPLVTPAILPSDVDFRKDEIPAETDGVKPSERQPDATDDVTDNPEAFDDQAAVDPRPLPGNADDRDVRELMNRYAPHAR